MKSGLFNPVICGHFILCLTLAQLANQERLYLAFYGNELDYRFTKVIPHDRQQWQYLDELSMEAQEYWSQIPPDERDFDRAKAEFMRRFV